jgi:hypothetical protein
MEPPNNPLAVEASDVSSCEKASDDPEPLFFSRVVGREKRLLGERFGLKTSASTIRGSRSTIRTGSPIEGRIAAIVGGFAMSNSLPLGFFSGFGRFDAPRIDAYVPLAALALATAISPARGDCPAPIIADPGGDIRKTAIIADTVVTRVRPLRGSVNGGVVTLRVTKGWKGVETGAQIDVECSGEDEDCDGRPQVGHAHERTQLIRYSGKLHSLGECSRTFPPGSLEAYVAERERLRTKRVRRIWRRSSRSGPITSTGARWIWRCRCFARSRARTRPTLVCTMFSPRCSPTPDNSTRRVAPSVSSMIHWRRAENMACSGKSSAQWRNARE